MMRALSRSLAESRLMRPGKRLWEANQANYFLPLTTLQKLMAGGYLILHDYHAGLFPPTFTDQAKAYQGERDYRSLLVGSEPSTVREGEMRKPFWFGRFMRRYLLGVVQLADCFARLGIHPPSELLELGCGTGWLSEFLAQADFTVVGTTIAPADVADAERRKQTLLARDLPVRLEFVEAPMESVHECVAPGRQFDAVFVFEALHHAFSWQATLESAYRVLKPGGWLLLCNEPNLFHTFSSYRVARLSNTHEIGMSRPRLMAEMRRVGFRETRNLGSHWHFYVRPHWLAGRK